MSSVTRTRRSIRSAATVIGAIAGVAMTQSPAAVENVRAPFPTPLFTDVSFSSNIIEDHQIVSGQALGTGAAWIDYDKDGLIDLYMTHRLGSNVMYKNLGSGVFFDITDWLGDVGDNSHDGAGVAVADFNNDGWRDIYLANSNEDVLLKNVNGQSFTDVTASAGLDAQGDARGTSASWGDYDKDGFLDLYVTNWQHIEGLFFDTQDHLFLNNGDETFTDVTYLLDIADVEGTGFIGAWTDYDRDRDLDIFLINDCPTGPVFMRLFRNDGGSDPLNWNFTEISDSLGIDNCAAGMGIAIGDLDHDGSFDYFYSNIGQPVLLHNQLGVMSDITVSAQLTPRASETSTGANRWTWGANFIDYNLDSWADLFMCSGRMGSNSAGQENLFFEGNSGGLTFTDVTDASGLADTMRSRTSVSADYDGDGDPDLFVVSYSDTARLYRNDNNNGNHHLIVELEGTVSNRDGVGAVVRIETASGYQYAEVHSGTSLGGGDDIAAYFGLGSDSYVSEVYIEWPSGIDQTLTGVAPDQRLKVVESATATGVASREPRLATRLYPGYPNPFTPSTTIRFDVPSARRVRLSIYDVSGRLVKTLVDGPVSAGPGSVQWDGKSASGQVLASGVYYVRLSSGNTTQTQKLVLVR